MDRQEILQYRGQAAYAQDGDKIGDIEDVYLDDQTGHPVFVGIGSGFLGTKHVLAPIEGAARYQDGLQLRYPKDLVKDAPDIDQEHITEQQMDQIYRYYSLQQGGGSAGAATLEGRERAVGGADAPAVELHEEQLRVGKREVPAGTARIRKWVETEPVTENVQLRRDTVEVHREPINRPASTSDFGEQEVEVELHSEEPVVERNAQATERVTLDRQQTNEQREVREEIRRERAEIEGADENLRDDDQLRRAS